MRESEVRLVATLIDLLSISFMKIAPEIEASESSEIKALSQTVIVLIVITVHAIKKVSNI